MHPDHSDDDMANLVRQFLQDRDMGALGGIFRRYYPKMIALASRRLKRARIPEAVYQPDDALASTLDTMMRFVLNGRLGSIEGVDGFWRLYRRILAWKIHDASDRHGALKRGGPGTRKHADRSNGDGTESTAAVRIPTDDFDLFESELLPVEVLAIGNEMTERLINLLQPDLQSVVRMRFDGWTIAQMATALGVSPRSVDRMLDSIRRIWLSSDPLRGVKGLERFRDEQP